MARFNIENVENYSKKGNQTFFSLKENKETARVRFLINNIDDLYGVSVHEVEENGSKFDVECIRNYDEPVNKCPLCAAGYEMHPKLFIPLYNEDLKKSQVWTRGTTYLARLSGLCERNNPLVGTPIEIERIGEKGDQKTTYNFYTGTPDNKRIEDFPQIDLENNAFQVKSDEEMRNFLNTGKFNSPQARQPINQSSTRQVPMRRTPERNEEDAF